MCGGVGATVESDEGGPDQPSRWWLIRTGAARSPTGRRISDPPTMTDTIRASYDAAAAGYARELSRELDGKPLDRWLLARLAASAEGPVCDVGCGPGHVTAFLCEHGADAFGVDLSPEMVAVARQGWPDLRFEVEDMTRLSFADASLGGVAAMYSLVHTRPADLEARFRELHRVLRPGGWLLAAAHLGDEVLHVDELFGAEVDLDFVMFASAALPEAARAAGFTLAEELERGPYVGKEHPSRRAYILGQR